MSRSLVWIFTEGSRMAKIQLWGWKCERCEHVWVPRDGAKEEPRVCPKCKSPYWNKPRKKPSGK